MCGLQQVRSAISGAGATEGGPKDSDLCNMHKRHAGDLAFVKKQLSQLAADNRQLLTQLLPKRKAAATAEHNDDTAEASDNLHEHIHQRARFEQDVIPVLARDEVLDTVFSFVGIGDYYYVAGVCRNWRHRYTTFCRHTSEESTNAVRPPYTSYSSIGMTQLDYS